jgi:CheY-like chemotaxis protein
MTKPSVIYFGRSDDSILLIARMLNAARFEVIYAYHDQEIPEQIKKQPQPALILIDDINTVDQVNKYAKLKSNPVTTQLPLIVITRPGLLTQDMLDTLDADQYILKPINPQQFKKTLQHYLARSA